MNLQNKAIIALEIAKARILKLKIPVILSWAATYRCNQQCLYCRLPEIDSGEMSTKQAKIMIDKLHKLGMKMINITGGEALLRPDIFDLIDYLKYKRIYVCLNSNGILVPAGINRLKALDLLNLSIEGPQAAHDSIRGKGAYDTVINAAEAALKSGIKVKFTTTLNKYNINCLDYVIELTHKFNIKVIFQILDVYMLGTVSENPLNINPGQVHKALSRIIFFKKQSKYRKTIDNSFLLLKYLMFWPDLPRLECASGNIVFRITPTGVLFPCAKATYEKLKMSNYSINLLTQDLEQIKTVFNSFCYPGKECTCACSNRLVANLVWNLKI